jgi:hypothetical protein
MRQRRKVSVRPGCADGADLYGTHMLDEAGLAAASRPVSYLPAAQVVQKDSILSLLVTHEASSAIVDFWAPSK